MDEPEEGAKPQGGWEHWCENVHVVPVEDTLPHVIKGTTCWCKPQEIEENEGTVIVHNSADGREEYENGRQKHSELE